MLIPRDVKPFLVHEDRSVRDAAMDYFRGTWSEDPDLVPLMLQAYRQYGLEECEHAIACCWQFVLTLQSIDEVLACSHVELPRLFPTPPQEEQAKERTS